MPWEYGRGPDPRYASGRDLDGNLPEPGAGRHQGGRDSGRGGHWRGRSHEPSRESANDKYDGTGTGAGRTRPRHVATHWGPETRVKVR